MRPPHADVTWAWFFDIDGTLVEIASTPSSIVVHDDLPHLISRLHELSGGAVSLVTGRAIADVDRLLSLPDVSIAGQHGFETRLSSGRVSQQESTADLEKIAAEISELTRMHPGLIADYKGASVALHYRRAPQLAGYVHRFMRDLQSRLGSGLVIQKGKKVVELRPADADKGQAIRALMQRKPFTGKIPVFVGDDLTDEAGFAAVNQLGGHSVKVGPGKSGARWRLKNVDEVRAWLSEAIARADTNLSRRNGTE